VSLDRNSSIWSVSGSFRVFDPSANETAATPSSTSSQPLPSTTAPPPPYHTTEVPAGPAAPGNGTLSTGAVVGIAVSCTIVLIIIVLVTFHITCKIVRRRAAAKTRRKHQQHHVGTVSGAVSQDKPSVAEMPSPYIRDGDPLGIPSSLVPGGGRVSLNVNTARETRPGPMSTGHWSRGLPVLSAISELDADSSSSIALESQVDGGGMS